MHVVDRDAPREEQKVEDTELEIMAPNHLYNKEENPVEEQTLQEHLHYIITTDQATRPKHLQVNEARRPNQAQRDPNTGNHKNAANTDSTLRNILEIPDVVAEQGYPHLVKNPKIGM